MGPLIRANLCFNHFSHQQIPPIFGLLEPGAWYTSAPAYLPDPLSGFFKGLVLRLVDLLQRLHYRSLKLNLHHV